VLDRLAIGKQLSQPSRIVSVDALRGFVMFMMIFVNDLAGAGRVVPDWMVHFSDRHHGGSGMTFVDLVFPAFLFLVGMSIPMALGARLAKDHSIGRALVHVGTRTVSLLVIGILMVHETPDTAAMGWSGDLWCLLMYLSAIAAFCSISPPSSGSEQAQRIWKQVSRVVRWTGVLMLIWLAFAFRGEKGQRVITLSPFSLQTEWYGILGLIGWAYLVASTVFLIFRQNRTAILGCMVLLMCLFVADRSGTFEGFWLNRVVGIGETLGSLAAIAAGGLLLGTTFSAGSEPSDLKARSSFTLLFAVACAMAALLLTKPYGISKNAATPSWCLWSCTITASLWYVFHLISDVRPPGTVVRTLAVAGQNVLLAYLISEMLPSLLAVLGLSAAYGSFTANLATAISRSIVCAVLILSLSSKLNRIGFRTKL
jgi:predicted acyltransferase